MIDATIHIDEYSTEIFDVYIGMPENLPLGDIIFTAQDTKDLVSELTIKFDRKEIECMDISKLKKQIKHCKNLLERKALERQLNKAYKARKAKKCVSEHKTEEC